MPPSEKLLAHLQTVIKQHTGEQHRLSECLPVSGGYISKAYRLVAADTSFFIKFNDHDKFPAMFAAEAEGLQILAKTGTVAIPRVIATGSVRNHTYLVMEWIEQSSPTPASMEALGRQLAAMHFNGAPQFGLHRNNYMSSFPQSNNFHNTWDNFFALERLQPMVALAHQKGALDVDDCRDFEALYQRLKDLFPPEPPALVHGDLWKGNCIVNNDGTPYLFDPAVYFGNREVDIAMTFLMENFGKHFYQAYNEVHPLQKGWEQRIGLWNLYPMLILLIYGGDYRQQIKQVLKMFI